MDSVRYIVGKESTTREASKARTVEDQEVRILVERAVKGNVEAFGDLYSIHLDRIYRYIFYQVNDRTTAEDLTEEVFIKAWKNISKFKWKGHPFSSWLYRIARNHVIDYFRTSQQQKPLEGELPDSDAGPEREVEIKQMNQLIYEAVSTLPQQQRQLIILKFIEGLDNWEIEKVMGKNQGAIRVMQMRALAALRQKLAGGMNDAG
jgi:RNA polymerase sigma-70 factor (ECF subfamily)